MLNRLTKIIPYLGILSRARATFWQLKCCTGVSFLWIKYAARCIKVDSLCLNRTLLNVSGIMVKVSGVPST